MIDQVNRLREILNTEAYLLTREQLEEARRLIDQIMRKLQEKDNA